MSEVRWGVLSTANIGRRAVVPAIAASSNGRLVAVASRNGAAAEAYAGEFGITRAYGSYQALLDDPEVDAVYIPLPNSLHRPWTVRAAEAGKHVLCEKPLALTSAEARTMAAAASASGVILMEAFMYRFHPRTEAVLKQVRRGLVGDLRLVRSAFTFSLRSRDNIRFDPELGGGALMDVGCYCVTISRLLYATEPLEVQAWSRVGTSGVDEELVATLRFPGDAFAQFHCALTLDRLEYYHAVGRSGRLEVERAFLPGDGPVEWSVHGSGAAAENHRLEGVDQYRLMVEHFAECVLSGARPRYPVGDAVLTLQVIEALLASARHGGVPVKVGSS